jgi:hypothetical protein
LTSYAVEKLLRHPWRSGVRVLRVQDAQERPLAHLLPRAFFFAADVAKTPCAEACQSFTTENVANIR